MVAVDVSLLAYAVNRFAPEHARASAVLETLANGEDPWALPLPVLHEFVRLVTHSHAVVRPMRPVEAWTFVEEVLESASLTVLGPTPRHAGVSGEVIRSLPGASGIPAGLETAVVLREHGVRELLSSDRGMRAFTFLSVRDPVHGELWTPGERPARRYRRLRATPNTPRS